MGTGSSRAVNGSTNPAPASHHSAPSGGAQPTATTPSTGVRAPTGGNDRLNAFEEWLLGWLASLPPIEDMEEEKDDEDGDAGIASTEETPGGTEEKPTTTGETPTTTEETPTTPTATTTATTTTTTGENQPPAQPRLPSLKVVGVKMNTYSNAIDHRTEDYEFDKSTGRGLVVRRGQEFKLVINLSREFKPSKERIFLQFTAKAKVPRPMDGTRVSLDIEGTYEAEEWSAKIDSSSNDSITVQVKSAPNAIVGTYSLSVKVQSRATSIERMFPQDQKILVLFNAWCEQDSVFMEDEAERKEYVLEDSGSIWRGNSRSNRPKLWNFGQFDLDVRQVVIDLLEGNVKAKDRRNPIKVSRALSHVINEFVLEGNWSGNYDGGTRPTRWKGSVKILEEYAKTKSIVKFGQCWVYSGLFTTFLRCIGIPARSVTNFDSAHDTEDNMTIDRFQDPEGNVIDGGDSVWNFHVWNEAWMTRPDLDPGYGGWQAVDATPQELSDGLYQCGPAPVIAVKRGMVNQGHDTRFVFAEVNADEVRFEVRASRTYPNDPHATEYIVLGINTDKAGHKISTKEVGGYGRKDITLEYKNEEGSSEERAAVKHAVSKGFNRDIYKLEGHADDVTFDISVVDDVWIGQDFDIKIEATNKSSDARKVFIKTKVESCYYTGIRMDTIKTETMELVLQGSESISNTINVKADEYLDKMDDEGLFTVVIVGAVKETGKALVKNESIRLKQADLEVNSEVTGSEVKLTVEFTNPLNRTLTNCEFEVEAPKLVRSFKVSQSDIGAKEKITREITFTARGPGRKTVIVELDSTQLKDIEGSVMVEVKPSDDDKETD